MSGWVQLSVYIFCIYTKNITGKMAELMSPETEKKDEEQSSKLEGKEKSTAPSSGSLQTVLRQSDWKHMLLIGLGSMGSVADGSAMALIMIILSSLMNGYAGASLTLEDINKVGLNATTNINFPIILLILHVMF